MSTVTENIEAIALRAREASRTLATASSATKDRALEAMAEGLVAGSSRIVKANGKDLERGRENGMADGLLDRLSLDPSRIEANAAGVRELIGLQDPIGQVVRGSTLANGIALRQLRVPMGVVGIIYEARPNVTADAAGLALKSGNAVILRGGSAAEATNEVIIDILRSAVESVGLPRNLVQTIDPLGREGAVALMHARGFVDVLVPRGGSGLIQTVVNEASVPVIETGVGNCHVYVDGAADLEQALAIVLNSKTHRPSVCNAAETLLVSSEIADSFLPVALSALSDAGVRLHCDGCAAQYAPDGIRVLDATDEDWAIEYLSMEMAVAVVDGIDQAIEHIQTWSSGHTEAICTQDLAAAQRFVAEVDSAAVNVNASTRFTDGGEYGLGAEIGISTQKLHARGPMGLEELTTTKWVAWGSGQIRE